MFEIEIDEDGVLRYVGDSQSIADDLIGNLAL
jgi:hypothetical protein